MTASASVLIFVSMGSLWRRKKSNQLKPSEDTALILLASVEGNLFYQLVIAQEDIQGEHA
jgi:hypothetical protein